MLKSTKMFFPFSALTIMLNMAVALPTLADVQPTLSINTEARQSTYNNIIAPRQFTLEQFGTPSGLRVKQQRGYDQTPLQSTGYWVNAGDTLEIELDYEAPSINPEIELFVMVPHDRTHKYQNAFKKGLQKGTNSIRVDKAGIVYIAAYHEPVAGKINVHLKSGGEPMTRFVLGKHNQQDWQNMLQQYSHIPYAELVGDRMMVSLRLSAAKQYVEGDGPAAVLRLWDEIVGWAEDQYGLTSEDKNSVHQRIPHRFHFLDGLPPPNVVNDDECYGELNAWTWRLQSCSEDGIKAVVNAEKLRTDGWGPWHELGHHFQNQLWTWDHMGEVVVNLTSLYVQRQLQNPPELEKNKVWQQKIFPYLNQPIRQFDQQDVWIKLGMLWQLDLTFGEQFYTNLGTHYRDIKPGNLTSAEKIQLFILETSRISGHDLQPFFKQWGLTINGNTAASIAELNLMPLTDPIWENHDYDIKYDLSGKLPGVFTAEAHANPTQIMGAGNVQLSAKPTGSDFSYQWQKISGPNVILSNTNQAIASANLEHTEREQTFVFEVTVTNKKTGQQSRAKATVKQLPDAALPLKVTATANPAEITGPGDINLSAIPSTSHSQLTYQWQTLVGENVQLSNSQQANAQARLPKVTKETVYTFQVKVMDPLSGAEADARVQVKQKPEGSVGSVEEWKSITYFAGSRVCYQSGLFEAKWYAGPNNKPDLNGPTSSSQPGWGSQPWLLIEKDSSSCR